jgi:hypothetical protein
MSLNKMDESIEILTDEDISLINNFVEKPNLRLLIFMVLFTILSYFASFLLDTYIPLVFFGIFTAIAATWYFWMKAKIAKYTRLGTKKIVVGVLENKFEKTVVMRQTKNFASSSDTFGFFTVSGFDYMVPYQYYELYNQGDKVCLHLTNVDDIVFKVTK